MRVTNGMIINNSLNGLYNNLNAINKTYGQMVTGKKIQTVSDDPIIAGRALKLKTTVLETAQYQSNVKEATSWMEVTESSLGNMEKILETIRTKCVQASTGTLDKTDKEAIKVEIEQLWKQLQEEANATYGGRYIFSGYKTKDPLILAKDMEVKGSALTAAGDIVLGGESKLADGSVLAAGSELSKGSQLGAGTSVEGSFTLGAGTTLSAADAEALLGITLEDGKYCFDADTTLAEGTVLTEEQVQKLEALNISVTPADYTGGPVTLEADVTIPKGTTMDNDLSKALFGLEGSADSYTTTVKQSGADHTFTDSVTLGAGSTFEGEITVHGETTLKQNSELKTGSTLEVGSTLSKGTLNPAVVGHINGHAIEYEIGTNSTINVNTQGMDGIFVEMAQCFNEIFLALDEALQDDSVTNEDLHNLFTRKLGEIDDIMANISSVTSDLGGRMNRVEYVDSRLTDQGLTFKQLLSNTEDIDIEETYVLFNVQYATYQSALQATSKVILNTLADYL